MLHKPLYICTALISVLVEDLVRMQVLMPTATSTRRQLQPMMPAQGSTISDTTHFTGGQVSLRILSVPWLLC